MALDLGETFDVEDFFDCGGVFFLVELLVVLAMGSSKFLWD